MVVLIVNENEPVSESRDIQCPECGGHGFLTIEGSVDTTDCTACYGEGWVFLHE
jgi:hypothetical protein